MVYTKPKASNEGTNAVANLAEEIQNLVGEIHTSGQKDVITSFAYAALTADQLEDRFMALAEWFHDNAEDREDLGMARDLAEMSEQFQAIAEDAAECAEALKGALVEGTDEEDIDMDKVEGHFREMMDAVFEGLDLYAVLTGDEDVEEIDEKKGHGWPWGHAIPSMNKKKKSGAYGVNA